MLSISETFKDAISTGDDAKIKETGPQLETTWRSFEDSVKPKYPDSYEEVEKYLDPLVAASQAKTLDKAVLAELDDGLLRSLKGLLRKVAASN
ncbi:MAG: hypothetical protein IRZ33_10430 [Alicyclobacillaceae bacterium]|nr:hypothetical protein [Alicyclobacillaceae bacterium]